MTCCVEGLKNCGFILDGTLDQIIRGNHQDFKITKNKETGKLEYVSDFWYDDKEWDCCDICCCIPIFNYIAGSIGYVIVTIGRVIRLAATFLNTFNFCCNNHTLKDRGIILLDTSLALLIAIIGCACPPLAYYLDSAARNAMWKLAGCNPSPKQLNRYF